MVARKKLKIGIITDGGTASDYVVDLADWIHQQENLELTAEIVQRVWFMEGGQVVKKVWFMFHKRGWLKVRRTATFRLLSFFDQVLTKKISNSSFQYLHKKGSLNPICTLDVWPQVSAKGYSYEYSDVDLNRISELQCDVLIRCGSGILKGKILNCVKFGVLSFHHGDNLKFRGGPPGFWEVIFKENQTGFIIQQLTEKLDGGKVLSRGSVGTKPLFTWNRSFVVQQANYAMFKLLSDLAERFCLPESEPQKELGVVYQVPSISQSFRYSFLTLVLLTRKLYERILRSQPVWSVYIFNGDWTSLEESCGVEIPNPKGFFTADPFLISGDDCTFLFAEEFSYEKKKAHIVVYEIESSQPKRLGVALSEEFHISFPYVFKHDGSYFMCPETLAAGQVRLYRATTFPLQWELASILIDEIRAVDPLIFYKDSRWWLLLNSDPFGNGDSHSLLEVYSSSDLLSGNWQASTVNPVLFDASCARNGGLIRTSADLIRLGQVQGFNNYGQGLRAFKVKDISEHFYLEVENSISKPNIGTKYLGTHHLSTTGSITAVDIFR